MAQYYVVSDELCHHGILGMKWGVRRYQNEDGTLTAAGRKRYGSSATFESHKKVVAAKKEYDKSFNAYYKKRYQAYSLSKKKRAANGERLSKARDDAGALVEAREEYKTNKKIDRALKRNALLKSDRDSIQSQLSEGRKGLSKEDVNSMITALDEMRLNDISKYDNTKRGRDETEKLMKELSSSYNLSYDVSTRKYSLTKRK